MRVLVTGGAGFIGSHLADALLGRGDEVAVVDDLSAGRPDAGPGDAAQAQRGRRRRARRRRRRRPARSHLPPRGPDRCPHVGDPAGRGRGGERGRHRQRARGGPRDRGQGAARLDRRCAVRPGCTDPVAGGRAAAAGVALRSGQALRRAVRHALQPPARHRPHGAAAGERLRAAAGPGREAGVVAIFCAQVLAGERPTIFGDGRQTRDYVYIGDAIAALLAAADQGRPGIWNVGSGAEVSVLELARVIGKVSGREIDPVFAPARPGELLRSALAPERARRDLGWAASTPLAAGVARVYRWLDAGAPERAEY